MGNGPVLRFAPSPNGRLHLGHAFSALFTARAAAALGGTFLLRIEDIDPIRSKPEFEAGIIEDLVWLGLSWAPYPLADMATLKGNLAKARLEPVWRQSARMAAYTHAAEELKVRGLLYPCFCSRRSAAASASSTDPDGAPLYSGTCRRMAASEAEEHLARGGPVQWRLNMDRAAAEAGPLTIAEAPAPGPAPLWAGTAQRPAQPTRWGDAVLIRKDVPASYHLSVVTDDAAQGVTHVTRGMDLFAATDLHVLLQHLLGLPSPLYCHHRLMRDSAGQKLAKSKGSASLKSLRESGWSAADVRQRLGFD